MMVALAYLGYDINTTDPEELAEAGDLLLAQKPLVRGYGADNIKYDMIGGGVALGVDYSGSAVQAIMENEDLAYVVPKEGSNVWMDNFVVLKSSPNKDCLLYTSSQVNVGFEGLREVFYGEKCQKYISDSIMKQMTKELSKIKGIIIK